MILRPGVRVAPVVRDFIPEEAPLPHQQHIRDAISDGVITARIRIELSTCAITAQHDIRVATTDGVAELSGFVETPVVSAAAVLLAQNVEGVRDVHDAMDVRNP